MYKIPNIPSTPRMEAPIARGIEFVVDIDGAVVIICAFL